MDALDQDQQDLRELQLLQENQKKQLEAASAPVTNPLEKLNELGYEGLDFKALMDERVVKLLKESFDSGALDNISAQDLKDKMKQSPISPLVSMFPKFFDGLVNISKDKKAMSSLLDLFQEKERAKTYGIIVIVTFVLFIFIRTRIVKPTWPFFKRFVWNTTFNLFYFVWSISFLYYWFYKNLSPSVEVFSRSF